MLRSLFAPFGPPRPAAAFVPPPGMRLQEYVLAYDEGRRRTVYLAAHDHGAAFGDAYLFDGKAWTQVAKGSLVFPTAQKLMGFYDEARAGVAAWSFTHDYAKGRHVAASLLFDVRDGLSPIVTRGDDPVAEVDDARIGTFDYRGLFAPDPSRAVTVCLTRRGVWELDADAVWRKRAEHDASFPKAWDEDGAGGAYDPARKRAVFWLYTRAPKREYAFFAWDGAALARLPAAGLPMERLHVGLFDPAALVAAHPAHGLVVIAGAHGAFAFDGARWKSLHAPRGDAPPRMKNARMVWDASAGGLVAGPGYHEGDRGGREQQRVFFVEKDGVWTRLGAKSEPSPLPERALHACVAGAWIAASPSTLQTLRWTDAGFVEIAAKTDGDRAGALVDAGGRALAITERGGVLALDGSWKRVRAPWRPFGERSGFSAAWDPPRARVVVFGGKVKERASNDTFFYADGAWRAPKSPSPLPAESGAFVLAFDSALGRVVRFGGADVAVLGDDDVWRSLTPEGYADLGGDLAWKHLPLHDPKTRETLLVNFARGAIARFDLARCEVVAELELPAELAPAKQHDPAAYHALIGSLCFDPETRLLHAQDEGERARRYALDLGPAFDAASALGARTELPAPPAPETHVRLYHPGERAYFFVDGARATSGVVGGPARTRAVKDAAVAAKRRAGFVPAGELDADALARLAARESRALAVGKKTTLTAVSRIGGLPSARWPSAKKKLGFLFQLECAGVLRKHAGVAVFCATDGTATEAASNNAAVLVSAAAWKKKPAAAPRGVPTLAARALTLGDARPEIDEAAVRPLAEADPELAAALERFQKTARVQGPVASKLGGAPLYLQGAPRMPARYTFLAQLDFDGVENGWGLAGCVYVFVRDDEKDARVFWQCT